MIKSLNGAIGPFVIHGRCYSMKNSKEEHVWRGRLHKQHHPAAVKFREDFARQVPPQYRDLKMGGRATKNSREVPVMLWAHVTVFYPDWRQDPDFALIYDLLQATGVVRNDRWIRHRVEDATLVDKSDPRVEIMIGKLVPSL